MYQGSSLAGTSLAKGKRHPTIGNNVVIGAGAVVLGSITVGDGARIGAGSVVIHPVPSGVTVVGIPGRVVTKQDTAAAQLEHGRLPDPVAEAIRLVLKEYDGLEKRLEKLEEECGLATPPDELVESREEIEKEFTEGGGI
jgi:serine O-acetyltransferase